MQLDLTEILRNPGTSTERKIEFPAGPFDEWELVEPVTGWVRASNARRNIVVRGKAQTAVQLECGRCLKEFPTAMQLNLDVVVPIDFFNDLLGAAAVAEEEDDTGNELTREEIAVLFHEHALDVTELVRQAIVLAAPIAPVCSDDCPGLPEASLYEGTEGDPRWAALQKLQRIAAHEETNGLETSQDGAGG